MRPPRSLPRLLPALLALAALAAPRPAAAQEEAAPKAAPAFVHVQLDKPQYRLGDTVWFRVHRPGPPAAVSVSLRGPGGELLETAAFPGRERAAEGSLFLDPQRPGGTYRVRATTPAGELLHEAAVEVYDVRRRQLDLSLRVLGEVFYPGDTLTAAAVARDLAGEPLVGRALRWRATFGALSLEGETGPTDAEGRALVRLTVPAEALRGGHLALGLEEGRGRGALREAVARPLRVSGSVSRVDAFPEGGAVVPGQPHRLGLLVRDLDGRPTPAEGRVLDDHGRTVAVFRADAAGCAAVEVPYAADAGYALVIDRPARARARFALPRATGHEHALRLEPQGTGAVARVWGAAGRGDLVLRAADGAELQRRSLRLDGRTPANAALSGEGALRARWVTWEVDGRATLLAPLTLGLGSPLQVQVRPATTAAGEPPLPGGAVALDVLARLDGEPVAADLALSVFHTGVTEDGRHLLADLTARALLAPLVGGHASDAGRLFAPDLSPAAARAARDAYLLVRGACALPPQGVAVEDLLAGEPFPQVRSRPPALTPRPALEPADDETRARPDALGRLLARAPFTRPAAPRGEAPRALELPGGEQDPPGLGRLARRPPQEARVRSRQVDTRDTRCWEAAVRTDERGRARVVFRVGHELGQLAVVAQGFAGDQPGALSGYVEPESPFGARVEVPEHLRVGDTLTVTARVEVRDGSQAPLALRLDAPPCLRALDETTLEHDPRLSPPLRRVRFEVVAPAAAATLRVVTSRGGAREVLRLPFSVGYPSLEETRAEAGLTAGPRSFQVSVPSHAVPGSVEARARVAPRTSVRPGSAAGDMERLLRQPYGCFEQTTSITYPNLMVLEALLETSQDAALLERAYELAEVGYRRLLTFRDAESGGFALYPGRSPAASYTARAAVQLAHYGRLFDGRGAAELHQAGRWLEAHAGELSGAQLLCVAQATCEAGLAWSGLARVPRVEPATRYEQALLADYLSLPTSPWPADAPASREQTLRDLLLDLRQARDEEGLVPSAGQGIMGSRGEALALETTAFAACAWLRAGETAAADAALESLLRHKDAWGGWSHTWGTATALRAMSLNVRGRSGPRPRLVPVTLSAGPGARREGFTGGGLDRPLTLSQPLEAAPGASLTLDLELESDDELEYGLGITYRVDEPRDGSRRPYFLTTTLPRQGAVGEPLALSVDLVRTNHTPESGQVVLELPLPGGCRLASPPQLEGLRRYELKEGQLILYWESPPETNRFTIQLEPRAAGSFRAPPARIYAYYEPDQVVHAPGLTLQVLPAYDLELGGAALQEGLLRGQ